MDVVTQVHTGAAPAAVAAHSVFLGGSACKQRDVPTAADGAFLHGGQDIPNSSGRHV
jgi:hypothetical protein